MLVKKIIFCLIVNSCRALSIYPKFNKEFYCKPFNLHNEIKILNKQQIDLISNNWRQNILNHLQLSNYQNLDLDKIENNNYTPDKIDNSYEETILNKLISLDYILSNNDEELLFFGWTPTEKKTQTNKYLLQLLICNPNHQERILNILEIIDSPFWDSDQISSLKLKSSIENLIKTYNRFSNFSINYQPLFERNLRYRLEWRDLTL